MVTRVATSAMPVCDQESSSHPSAFGNVVAMRCDSGPTQGLLTFDSSPNTKPNTTQVSQIGSRVSRPEMK